MACEGGRAGRGAPSLVAISLDWLATNINLVSGLDFVPEDLVVSLFQGRLTPRVLDKFLASGHPAIAELVDKLRIRNWTPPLIVNDGRGFLGDKSHLW
ncbi:hypothetical protein QBZ16_000461 [Prototheca wickerhamii]|uniref:Uncharacterized protein n=1 Tax=Prototheca wickerhamii TaxID=3111 RepID=A0AAD9IPX4_PROWI|nr:hypothetical protein QBZ16_000461 [Prototheca wickerhamii]